VSHRIDAEFLKRLKYGVIYRIHSASGKSKGIEIKLLIWS